MYPETIIERIQRQLVVVGQCFFIGLVATLLTLGITMILTLSAVLFKQATEIEIHTAVLTLLLATSILAVGFGIRKFWDIR